jgi:hypothetical protein
MEQPITNGPDLSGSSGTTAPHGVRRLRGFTARADAITIRAIDASETIQAVLPPERCSTTTGQISLHQVFGEL